MRRQPDHDGGPPGCAADGLTRAGAGGRRPELVPGTSVGLLDAETDEERTARSWSGPTSTLPARTWGKVFFSAPDGDYVCSGTAVSSRNESVVWTAGHCAANPGAKSFYNDHWIFVPGYDNGKAPFGKVRRQAVLHHARVVPAGELGF